MPLFTGIATGQAEKRRIQEALKKLAKSQEVTIVDRGSGSVGRSERASANNLLQQLSDQPAPVKGVQSQPLDAPIEEDETDVASEFDVNSAVKRLRSIANKAETAGDVETVRDSQEILDEIMGQGELTGEFAEDSTISFEGGEDIGDVEGRILGGVEETEPGTFSIRGAPLRKELTTEVFDQKINELQLGSAESRALAKVQKSNVSLANQLVGRTMRNPDMLASATDIRRKVMQDPFYDPTEDINKVNADLAESNQKADSKPIEWVDNFGVSQSYKTPRQFQSDVVKPLQKELTTLTNIKLTENNRERRDAMDEKGIASEAELERQWQATANRYQVASNKHRQSLIQGDEDSNEAFFKALSGDGN
jgi:hypothetical protein